MKLPKEPNFVLKLNNYPYAVHVNATRQGHLCTIKENEDILFETLTSYPRWGVESCFMWLKDVKNAEFKNFQ